LLVNDFIDFFGGDGSVTVLRVTQLKKHLRNGVESPSEAEEVTNRTEPNAQ